MSETIMIPLDKCYSYKKNLIFNNAIKKVEGSYLNTTEKEDFTTFETSNIVSELKIDTTVLNENYKDYISVSESFLGNRRTWKIKKIFTFETSNFDLEFTYNLQYRYYKTANGNTWYVNGENKSESQFSSYGVQGGTLGNIPYKTFNGTLTKVGEKINLNAGGEDSNGVTITLLSKGAKGYSFSIETTLMYYPKKVSALMDLFKNMMLSEFKLEVKVKYNTYEELQYSYSDSTFKNNAELFTFNNSLFKNKSRISTIASDIIKSYKNGKEIFEIEMPVLTLYDYNNTKEYVYAKDYGAIPQVNDKVKLQKNNKWYSSKIYNIVSVEFSYVGVPKLILKLKEYK